MPQFKHTPIWDEDEILFIKNFYLEKSDRWLGLKLKRPTSAVAKKRTSIGLYRTPHMDKLWTKEEEQIIKENFRKMTARKLSKLLPKRTPAAILAHAHYIGLKKNKPMKK